LISVRAFWRGTRGLIVHSCHIDILASVELGWLSGPGMSQASGLGIAGRYRGRKKKPTENTNEHAKHSRHVFPHIRTPLNFVQQRQWIVEKQLTQSPAGRHS